jgi:hypothetical protein
MGMYTELVLGARLKADTPQHIIEMLKVIFGHNEQLPEKYLAYKDLFPNIHTIPYGSSYYFVVPYANSKFSYDDILKQWVVAVRCSIKNYNFEIDNFIEWLMPYMEGSGLNNDFLGYTLYEEDVKPILLWCHE